MCEIGHLQNLAWIWYLFFLSYMSNVSAFHHQTAQCQQELNWGVSASVLPFCLLILPWKFLEICKFKKQWQAKTNLKSAEFLKKCDIPALVIAVMFKCPAPKIGTLSFYKGVLNAWIIHLASSCVIPSTTDKIARYLKRVTLIYDSIVITWQN